MNGLPVKTAFLLAAGQGTRLQPWTHGYPKPLMAVGRKPLIFWHLDQLTHAGITHVLVNLHHQRHVLKSWIEFYIHSRSAASRMRITFLEEPVLLGTGGALSQAEAAVSEEWFFVINSDILHAVSLTALTADSWQRQALSTLVLTVPAREAHRQVGMNEGRRLTALGPLELPPGPVDPRRWGFTGIQLLNRRVFDYVPKGKPSCVVRDVFRTAMEKGEWLAGYTTDAYWREIGDLEQMRDIHGDLLDGRMPPELRRCGD